MALIKCPECKNDISDKSTICIHCGFPIKEHLEINDNKDYKSNQDDNNEKEKYWCRQCYRQNVVGIDYCKYCGNRLTPLYKPVDSVLANWRSEEKPVKHEFKGIYKYTILGDKQEVYCPRCGSENCSHYKEQKVIPEKTKTRYTANLNPLRPFTLVNKKEKVIQKEQIVTENKIICNKCGNIFR